MGNSDAVDELHEVSDLPLRSAFGRGWGLKLVVSDAFIPSSEA